MISVRRLEQGDLATRVAWLNSPAIYTQMVVDLPISLAATQQWFARTLLDDRRRDFAFLAPAGDLVAMGGLTDIEPAHGRAELYILVDPERQGQGFGTPAVRWLCTFGFIQLNLSRIYLFTMAANEGARRFYERLGFVHEGVLRRHTRQNGVLVDRHVQGLLREEWEAASWRATPPLRLVEE